MYGLGPLGPHGMHELCGGDTHAQVELGCFGSPAALGACGVSSSGHELRQNSRSVHPI